VYLGSIDGKESQFITASDADAAYSLGYIFFVRNGLLMAQAFDVERNKLKGEPRPTSERVVTDSSIWKAVFDASESGIMAYQLGGIVSGTQLRSFDRSGKQQNVIGKPGYQYEPHLSRDGRQLAAGISYANYSDIWTYNLPDGRANRITFGERDHGSPVWSSDGSRIILAEKQEHYRICQVDLNGVQPEKLVLDTGMDTWPLDLSADDRFLLFGQGYNIGRVKSQLWIYPMTGESPAFRLLTGDAVESDGQFSPDGQWVAYASNESGRNEVYVVPFHMASKSTAPGYGGIEGKRQISISGGQRPRWRRDGKELYYVKPDSTFVAVPIVSIDAKLEIGAEEPLFRANPAVNLFPYDVSPDGSKFFVVTAPPESTAPITLVENWPSDFRR
jgi:dipeptidyl aminopeptidase/acylaminoacyl peptidase